MMIENEVQLFGLGLHGKSPNVTSNKLINAYYEFQQERDRTSVAIYGTPGLELFIDRGATPWRGLYSFTKSNLLYGVHRDIFYEINNAGVVTNRGTISSSVGRVDIADDGRYIVVVDGSEIYYYDTTATSPTITAVTDVDRPTSPNTCIFQGGRILTDENTTGQFKGCEGYDPTAWDALDYATAESNPDELIRIVNYRGTVVLFGAYTTEFWSNVGGSGFPYSRIMGADMEYGLAARWSVAKFGGTYAFLARNREGQVSVMMLNGYAPQKISNMELDHIINGYASKADATGLGYNLGGHQMYQLNFPVAGKSWLYDFSTNYWSELRYGANEAHRAEIAVDFVNETVVSDRADGKLYRMKASVYTDNGEPIITVLRGRHLYKNKKMVSLGRLELGLEAGVGLATGQGSDPVAGLRLSKDGGNSFGTQTFAPIGKVGQYTNRCIWRRLGRGRDIVPEVTISEPIKKVITEATLHLGEGTA